MSDLTLSFRSAHAADAAAIAALVNSGYRGDASRAGWTTEADYLEGARTDENEVRAIVSDPNSAILLAERTDENSKELIGSVHLQRKGSAAYLGMFVVRPTLQGQGVGKQFMEAAEHWAVDQWHVRSIRMSVISLRASLIAFYERRGYRLTGERAPFPIEDKRSTLTVPSLEFVIMEKSVS